MIKVCSGQTTAGPSAAAAAKEKQNIFKAKQTGRPPQIP